VSEQAALAAFSPGTVLLEKYRIIREIGAGGMGVVLCAEHLALGALVAIKFLLPEFAALPDAGQRFVREARASSRIQSEHIARVLDAGTLPDGQPFLVMEYLDGMDLSRHLKSGRVFSIEEAIDFTVQAAEALCLAHRAGIIHRDIKPANLFLTQRPDGTPLVKMLDFGISKIVEEAAQENLELTRTSAVMGSALYMSLEQMRSARSVDARTDIYALGVTLYELLSHTYPFTAESFSELCVKVSLDPPDPLRRHRPDVPEDLAEVIARAYARYPNERYPTVGTFVSALAPFAAPETLPTIESIQRFERASSADLPLIRPPPPPSSRSARPERPRRDRVPWGTVITTGICAAVASAMLAWWYTLASPLSLGAIDGGEDAAPSAAPSESAPIIPASAVVVSPPPSASSPSASFDAGLAASSSSSASPPLKPRPRVPPECRRGGLFYIDPRSGMRRACPH